MFTLLQTSVATADNATSMLVQLLDHGPGDILRRLYGVRKKEERLQNVGFSTGQTVSLTLQRKTSKFASIIHVIVSNLKIYRHNGRA